MTNPINYVSLMCRHSFSSYIHPSLINLCYFILHIYHQLVSVGYPFGVACCYRSIMTLSLFAKITQIVHMHTRT